jgi:DNA-binding PadR family transcriptional regulator
MARAPSLEYALLGLLRQKPQAGYDLRKQFVTSPVRHFSDSPGSIYPALRRLQTRDWIAPSANTSARQRQVFRVTAAGKRALVDWLQQPVTREDVIWRHEELMLRFAFQDGNVERRITLNFLEELECALAAYLGELREFAAVVAPKIPSTTGRLAFLYGLEGYEAQLAWTRRARQQLAEKLS